MKASKSATTAAIQVSQDLFESLATQFGGVSSGGVNGQFAIELVFQRGAEGGDGLKKQSQLFGVQCHDVIYLDLGDIYGQLIDRLGHSFQCANEVDL